MGPYVGSARLVFGKGQEQGQAQTNSYAYDSSKH